MKNISAVKLLKSTNYTTYQFYGQMANKNTNVTDGLKYAVLTTFEWLRERLANTAIPEELNMPAKEEYKRVRDDQFRSFSISDSYRMNVIADLKEGIWALRISEQDSGQISKDKIPVVGRTIQSDIGYRIVDGKLECGFKTTIYDSSEVEKADCIRFRLIKTLGMDPIFGFRHVTDLLDTGNREIVNESSFEHFKFLLNSKENELPFIIYTDTVSKISEEEIRKKVCHGLFLRRLPLEMKQNLEGLKKNAEHLDNARNKYYGIARVFFLSHDYFEKVASLLNKPSIECNQVITVDARRHGGKSAKYLSDDKTYSFYLFNYTREKETDFHGVLFLKDAGILLREKEEAIIKKHQRLLDEKDQAIDQLQSRKEKEERLANYKPADDRDSEFIDELKQDLKDMKEENSFLKREKERLKNELNKKNSLITYLERKTRWPRKHEDIVEWCSDYQYVEFNNKAVDCLKNNDATKVEIEVIMNALEYLEFAYCPCLFGIIDEDDCQRLSNDIYGRPYNITPSGIPTSARAECKIRYSFNGEKKKEIPLDQHLKIGGHGDNLLRIYFIIDKNRKKIVIGSLPNHLIY